MADFAPAFQKTLRHEGGYVHDPNDRGGETFCGISRKHHPNWEGWPFIDAHFFGQGEAADLRRFPMLMGQVEKFYRLNFWNRLRLDEVARQDIADELFDSAVNVGSGRAARWAQHACNLIGRLPLVEDGIMGPRTVEALNRTAAEFADALLTALRGQQFSHYHQLVLTDATQLRFFRGWLRRV